MKLTMKLRIGACAIWLVTGLIQGGLVGYASALASAMFLTAIRLETAGYED